MPHDPSKVKLGKLAPRHDARTLKLAKYLIHAELPKPPRLVDYSEKVESFPMLLNDDIGDCTIASALHQEQVWFANSGRTPTFPVTDAEAMEAYRRICGYNPDDPESDIGGVELDVLNAWRKDGIGGVKIEAFVKIDPQSISEVHLAIFLFGGIYVGLALPEIAQTQTVWTQHRGYVGAPGSWGGHAVNICGYDAHAKQLGCVTWGERKRMTEGFLHKYCDEAYALLDDSWLNAEGKSPTGLDMDALMRDLNAITGRSSDGGSAAPSGDARTNAASPPNSIEVRAGQASTARSIAKNKRSTSKAERVD